MAYDKKSFILGLATGLATRGVLRNPAKEEQQEGAYLTFSSPGWFILNTVTISAGSNQPTWNGTIEYSTDAKAWSVWSGRSGIVSKMTEGTHFLYLRGKNNTILNSKSEWHWSITSNTDVSCFGNIESLLDYEIFSLGQHPTMQGFCCQSLFSGCDKLVRPPSLSTANISAGCYWTMFQNTGIKFIPKLPSEVLQPYCYYNMLSGCTGIKLSTTRVGEYQTAYRIPSSGTGTTATNALNNMFTNTGGTFTGTPSINTTYYTSNEVV